jgi:hypothetical protein
MTPEIVLVIIGLVALGILSAISAVRTRIAFRRERDRGLADARAEVREQVAAMADGILKMADQLALEDDLELHRRYADVTATYTRAQDALERAQTQQQLEAVSDDLDHARWQLEAVQAALDGRALEAVEPSADRACFFDPTHGAGTDHTALETPAGRRTVRLCNYCAQQLRRGTLPQPRMIAIGGRSVPAAQAPRSHGGGGMTDLSEFDVVMQGGPTTHVSWTYETPAQASGHR